MNCTSCGASNEVDAVFCEECGESFRRECPSCGTSCSPRAKFCRKCRASLGGDTVAKTSERDPRSYTPKHLAERILAERAAMESRGAQDGERKTITALFADIKGSVEMMEGLDPEGARAIVDPALKLMMDAVHLARRRSDLERAIEPTNVDLAARAEAEHLAEPGANSPYSWRFRWRSTIP